MMSIPLIKLALKQVWRDTRAGDLLLLGMAVVVAVAAISSVGFLSDRVSRALERDAAQMLGGDIVVESDSAIPESLLTRAKQEGLKTARTWQFPSMVGSGQALQLASVKAVESGYPLRGALKTAPDMLAAPDAAPSDTPTPGKAWVDPQLLAMTGTKVGGDIKVGDLSLRVERVIVYEPDRGAQFVNVAPRLMMHADDLARSGLIAPGSRVGYALLTAGDAAAVERYRAWLEPSLKKGQKILSVESGRPEIRRALDRAQQFLSLVAMIAVLIAAVAVALAARRFGLRHHAAVAVMRCMGARQTDVGKILFVEFLTVAVVGALLGLLLGWIGQWGMVGALSDLVRADLPAPGMAPAWQGLFAGIWLLMSFALPPIQALKQIPPSQILRSQEMVRLPIHSLAAYAVGISGYLLLMWWIAGSARYGTGLAAGFVGAALFFAVLSALILQLINRVRDRLMHSPVWRFALAGMVRRRATTIAQTSALAIGMMAILLLTIVRTDLLAGWQRTLPPDAPNRFLINIQPDQKEAVSEALSAAGFNDVSLLPMVRGRLISRNDQTIGAADYEEPRAQRLVEREFNLSYADRVPDNALILEGRELNPARPEVSLEVGLANSLQLKLGDKLEFDVAGQPVRVDVTSIRRVDWDSMRANFFALMTPAALKDQPQTLMTAFHLPVERVSVLQDLVARFPNLTIFDVGAILNQLQAVLDQVSVAVQGLFVFSLLAGAMVLAAALSATRDQRVREAALMRALGANRTQLVRAQRVELLAVGALAGLMAAAGATAAAWALSHWVFEFEIRFTLWPWLIGVSVCMLSAWLAGAMALRGVLQTPPLTILRNA